MLRIIPFKKRMQCKFKVKLIFLLSIFFMPGCSFINTVTPPNNDKYLQDYQTNQAWEEQDINNFAPYLGQNAEKIRATFGEPKKNIAVNRSKYSNLAVEPYDLWEYGSLAQGESSGYNFLFRDGKLFKVESLGRKQSKLKKTAEYLSL